MERIDALVIGAGVLGLAVAHALARRGRDVVVMERHATFGEETSSRNSEVIHAGIYYPPGSLKARACVAGKERLYEWCAAHGVPHRRCGKLIVATSGAERAVLEDYRRLALANGAGTLEWVDPARVAELEPAIRCVAAIRSESTGIVDSHAFMVSLLGELERHGGMVAFNTPLEAAHPAATGAVVTTAGLELEAGIVVNAAGLAAPDVARMLLGDDAGVPAAHYAKGHYFVLSGRSPFNSLVYPIAESGGLGIHVTVDLGGQARFGPDVEWLERPDYRFDESRKARFAAAIRCYYPALDENRLQPGYTGIRPKIVAAGAPAADFLIDGPSRHGRRGIVSLLGMESPGLTASLALAEEIAEALCSASR